MTTSKVSNKYQVVIPKELRKKLDIKPGQTVYLSLGKKPGEVRVNTGSIVDEMYGAFKGAWGKNSDEYLRRLRDEADRDRT
jgi:AbrB family looped-hinge helix DNA binding protein